MNASVGARAEPKIGSRVHVFSADQTRDLGFGRYMGTVPVSEIPNTDVDSGSPPEEGSDEAFLAALAEAAKEHMDENTAVPKLVLDSGKTMYGLECFWKVGDEG